MQVYYKSVNRVLTRSKEVIKLTSNSSLSI